MHQPRIARVLTGLGVSIGVVAAGLAALDIQLNVPDWIIRVAMIKLALIASFGLIGAGAIVTRHARSRSLQQRDVADQLGEGDYSNVLQKDRDAEREAINNRSKT